MTTIESPATSADQRARWRKAVGLDVPQTAAHPRRTYDEGGAQLSWQPACRCPASATDAQ